MKHQRIGICDLFEIVSNRSWNYPGMFGTFAECEIDEKSIEDNVKFLLMRPESPMIFMICLFNLID